MATGGMTIRINRSTGRRLKAIKPKDKTWSELMEDLIEERKASSPEFLAAFERESREGKGAPWKVVKKRLVL